MRTFTPKSDSRPSLIPLLVLAGLAVAGAGEMKDPPAGKALDGEWVTTGRADDLQAYCDANLPGTLCAEWCEGLDARPTGQICCVPPEEIGFPGNRSACIATPP